MFGFDLFLNVVSAWAGTQVCLINLISHNHAFSLLLFLASGKKSNLFIIVKIVKMTLQF